MYKVAILSVLLALSGADAFWTACGGSATIASITSPSCDATRCVATRGEPLVATTVLTFAGVHTELMVTATATVLGIGVPLPIDPPDNNACNSLTPAGCPTSAGGQQTWVLSIDVATTLPAFQNSRVRFEVRDRGTLVTCVDLTADLI